LSDTRVGRHGQELAWNDGQLESLIQPTNYGKALSGILDGSEVSQIVEQSVSPNNKERVKEEATKLAAEGCVVVF
jgi:hypothetical protein